MYVSAYLFVLFISKKKGAFTCGELAPF